MNGKIYMWEDICSEIIRGTFEYLKAKETAIQVKKDAKEIIRTL